MVVFSVVVTVGSLVVVVEVVAVVEVSDGDLAVPRMTLGMMIMMIIRMTMMFIKRH